MNDRPDHNELIIRWLNGELSPEELADFEKSDEYAQYKAILDETDRWSLPPLDIDSSYDRLTQKKSKTRSIYWYQAPITRLAAVFLLLLVAILYFTLGSSSLVEYNTDLAETQDIQLPGLSKVHLGPSSLLSFDESGWNKARKLELKGTAYFQVTKGAPFQVTFLQGTVAVHGTEFEIKSFDNYASVMCYEGTVEVLTGDSTVMLTKGKGVKISLSRTRAFDFQNTSWSRSSTRFNQAPLSVVLKSLGSRFGVKVLSDNIDTQRIFTGAYTHDSLEVALNTVCTTMGLTYQKNGNTVTLQ